MAACWMSDLDIGIVQSAYSSDNVAYKLGTPKVQQKLRETGPSAFNLGYKRYKPCKFSSRERLVCRARTNVVEFGSNERAGDTEADSLDLFASNLSVLPLLEFKMSDFELCNNVSVGLAGRGDEVVYEAIVRNPDSNLKGSKVVLRQLVGSRAQRWIRHAMQVIKKLVRRAAMYQSYATQIYGYILPCGIDKNGLTLVHGYYGDYSLHQWLLCKDWLPTLESRLALDEECGRRVGDDRTGGPAVLRHLRLIQILMRDLLIGVNYLHSHGFAHTELRLQNVHISEVDRHIKVGLLGNASHFEASPGSRAMKTSRKQVCRRQLMIAYDMRCVGVMMARMVIRELMNPATFESFKSFFNKGNDPAGLREFLVSILGRNSVVENIGLQILDRNKGAGWNLLSLMLASKPSNRISCTEALRHPFLCGPKWRIDSSISMTRWSIGSAAVRIVEEYIYRGHQQTRLAQLIHILELLNPNSSLEAWSELLTGKWRLLYHTGRKIGLTWRKASPAILVSDVVFTFNSSDEILSLTSTISFSAMVDKGDWLLDKRGTQGKFEVTSNKVYVQSWERIYTTDLEQTEPDEVSGASAVKLVEGLQKQMRNRGYDYAKEGKFFQSISPAPPRSLPVIRLDIEDIDMTMEVDYRGPDPSYPMRSLKELRVQVPHESFDVSNIICGTYIDGRLLILRGISGSALFFVRTAV
ncbi:hypothetical protein KP509_31G029100 [Ceratopteris richardii]|uniref:Protein kinase domain-containing protein n=1 Tax=Ceratopteris richardii TaxID=49495 RepID=A0A8T2QYP2_CERRI|nr:hypothetical protein KP509_31G029100 [Ceratopteris richardii]KAH7288511.1 hypothetical protein KP509_31G029100 [Ceratopteris richardii]KAH7288512.1 hypothetical protein KP509_31G029100 [Ceratopteris richardii]KAH7288513.1 hypothetical protein KP509_31G029100 [Ceratopteris richardii]KAH7288514.1 hypothetical protein KP509_31G029100 [Ceratopteris richardii]